MSDVGDGNSSPAEAKDQIDGTAAVAQSQAFQTRLSSQAGQSSSTTVTVSRVQGRQQRSPLPLSAGNDGDSRLGPITRDQGQGQGSTAIARTATSDGRGGTCLCCLVLLDTFWF